MKNFDEIVLWFHNRGVTVRGYQLDVSGRGKMVVGGKRQSVVYWRAKPQAPEYISSLHKDKYCVALENSPDCFPMDELTQDELQNLVEVDNE